MQPKSTSIDRHPTSSHNSTRLIMFPTDTSASNSSSATVCPFQARLSNELQAVGKFSRWFRRIFVTERTKPDRGNEQWPSPHHQANISWVWMNFSKINSFCVTDCWQCAVIEPIANPRQSEPNQQANYGY